MASPAKRLKQSVEGYLCNVSPIKDANSPYFDAVLKHGSECSEVLVYRAEEHMEFKNAEKTRKRVKLEDVVLQPPKKSNGAKRVFYTHKSKMSCVRNLGYAFKHTSPARRQEMKLSEVHKLSGKRQTVNINVQIMQEESKGHNVVRDRSYLSYTVYTVADPTAYISLTLWNEQTIAIGEWYNITNVSVKKFKGKTTLTTTKGTKILKIPSQGTAVAVEMVTKTMTCEIIGAEVENLFICHDKHKLDVTPSSTTVYCSVCKIHYKTSAITIKISGRLRLKQESGVVIKVRAGDEVMRSVLTVKPNASQEDFIQGLLALPPMRFTLCDNLIVKMEHVSKSQSHLKTENESDQVLHSQFPVKMESMEDSLDFYSPPDPGLFRSTD